jgi:hypothetical protein
LSGRIPSFNEERAMKDEYWRVLAVSVVVAMMAVLLCLPAKSQIVLGPVLITEQYPTNSSGPRFLHRLFFVAITSTEGRPGRPVEILATIECVYFALI